MNQRWSEMKNRSNYMLSVCVCVCVCVYLLLSLHLCFQSSLKTSVRVSSFPISLLSLPLPPSPPPSAVPLKFSLPVLLSFSVFSNSPPTTTSIVGGSRHGPPVKRIRLGRPGTGVTARSRSRGSDCATLLGSGRAAAGDGPLPVRQFASDPARTRT